METERIILRYVIPAIKNLILDYAFKYDCMIEFFLNGYYEKCSNVLENDDNIEELKKDYVESAYCHRFIMDLGELNILDICLENAARAGQFKIVSVRLCPTIFAR